MRVPRDPPAPRFTSPIVHGRPPRHPAPSVTPPPVDSPDGGFVVEEIYATMSTVIFPLSNCPVADSRTSGDWNTEHRNRGDWGGHSPVDRFGLGSGDSLSEGWTG